MDTTSGDSIVGTLIRRPTLRLWNVASGEIVGTPMTVTYSFMTRRPDYAIGSFGEFPDSLKEATRDILNHYEAVSNLHFVEVDDSGAGGLIRLGLGDDLTPGSLGRANYPRLSYVSANDVWPELESGGDVWLDARQQIVYWPISPGGPVYGTLLHEIGHAVGLAHPGNYNNGTRSPPPPPYLPPELDNWDNTVMSYYPSADATGWPVVLGPFDVRALQYAYGLSEPGTIGNMTYGSDSPDTIVGTENTDWVHGQGGDDALLLGAGDDGARGVGGDDLILGEAGADTLRGNEGADLILGGDDNDSINGDEDGDDVNGNRGQDTVLGGSGADFVRGGQDDDLVDGGEGDDWHVNGNIGNDSVYGGIGNDGVFGGPGQDSLYGEDGNDTLSGDLENDMLFGGPGADMFVIHSNGGWDVIHDFNRSQGDKIVIQADINGTGVFTSQQALALATTGGGGAALLDVGNGHKLEILGVTPAQLLADDFLIM
ncbi:hemolysin type calcium-binding protein [Stella humosa]|uniref:Hemolysin type calcium-binding protein n=1 Tax=Stella humosa TaxID=94 RepID=A0A3N1M6Z4_9PROT|nr:hypothetical protein [Stella humosa]ROQ01592.1 hemolysin type calcium-binding protein [Stella humosa]BBK31972.1 hypothetical protein STHU_26060 [Stella humosa]